MSKESAITIEITQLAAKLADYASRKGWSSVKLCKEYPGLGSDRTFRDMVAGNTEGYDAEAQVLNLRAAWALVEEVAGESALEPVYENLSTVLALRRACLSAMKSWGTNRVVIVQGASGIGKSTILRILAGRYGSRIVLCEASEVWGDKPVAMLGAMLRSLGHEGLLPNGAVSRMEAVEQKLSISRRCMVIDEGHHLGPRCLNVIKTLVNVTPGEFVIVAIPTLWAKLESEAYQEARQISTNRLSERVRLALTLGDIAMYLKLANPGMAANPELAKTAACLIKPAAMSAGNMAFVRDVSRLLPEVPELADVEDAIKATAERR